MNPAQELSIEIHPHLHLISNSPHTSMIVAHEYYYEKNLASLLLSIQHNLQIPRNIWPERSISEYSSPSNEAKTILRSELTTHHHHHHPWTFNEWWTPNSPVTASDETNLRETHSWLNMSCTRDRSMWSSLTWDEETRRRSRSRRRHHREPLISRELW